MQRNSEKVFRHRNKTNSIQRNNEKGKSENRQRNETDSIHDKGKQVKSGRGTRLIPSIQSKGA